MKLAAINTIGLTGAEILAAELAKFPELLMLPGQNFVQFEGRCYRPHDYMGKSADEVFESLRIQLFTRSGHCWAGLTKSMTTGVRERYSPDRHREYFRQKAVKGASVLTYFRCYAESYVESLGESISGKQYFGYFGNNIVVNAPAYSDFVDDTVVINFSNEIDYWLANISQRMVWNNLLAIRFWLVNSLLYRLFEIESPVSKLTVDAREFSYDQGGVRAKLAAFLQVRAPSAGTAPDGFIQFEPAIAKRHERNAEAIRAIYGNDSDFQDAMNFRSWADDFLENPAHRRLLLRYQAFWNTTSHTNFDWVGPIEDEIVERIREHTGYRSSRNISQWFYHESFLLTSDNWEQPVSRLEHYLGCLEEEILLPEMPFYARVVLCYLESVALNYVKRPDSTFPQRQTNLYRRLTAPSYRAHFPRWALEAKFAEVEARIDAACPGQRKR